MGEAKDKGRSRSGGSQGQRTVMVQKKPRSGGTVTVAMEVKDKGRSWWTENQEVWTQ